MYPTSILRRDRLYVPAQVEKRISSLGHQMIRSISSELRRSRSSINNVLAKPLCENTLHSAVPCYKGMTLAPFALRTGVCEGLFGETRRRSMGPRLQKTGDNNDASKD